MKFFNAQQLLDHILSNNLGFVMYSKKMALNSCAFLLEQLNPDEEIEFAFLANVQPKKTEDVPGAIWVITNRRLLVVKRKLFGDFTQTISLKNINDVTINNSGVGNFGLAKITIDTIWENITAITNIRYGSTIYGGLHDIIERKKLAFTETQACNSATTHIIEKSPTEQILEFKNLLDLGIISQEEFDAKRKQLLGL